MLVYYTPYSRIASICSEFNDIAGKFSISFPLQNANEKTKITKKICEIWGHFMRNFKTKFGGVLCEILAYAKL